MRVQRFRAHAAAGPRGSAMIAVPFDPDEAWGAKAAHHVGGTINGRQVRGAIAPAGGGWAFSVTPMWMRDAVLSEVSRRLQAAAEGAFTRRAIDSAVVVCPAGWSSKIALLHQRGYRTGKLWMLRR